MVDVPVEPGREGEAPSAPRLIAVVPAYNEEPTVDRRTRPAVRLRRRAGGGRRRFDRPDARTRPGTGCPGTSEPALLTIDVNHGMSAAYYLAFSGIAERVDAGELPGDTLICTIDADGQHDPHSLDELIRIATTSGRRPARCSATCPAIPRYKRLGNTVLSKWAACWARSPLLDVESGYRVFRAGALADALQFYRGYRYSETVEVAVVLCRLGYKVRNDVVLPVPVFRSRTRLRDAVIDASMIVVAARRAAGRARLGRRARRARPAAVSTWSIAERSGNAAEPCRPVPASHPPLSQQPRGSRRAQQLVQPDRLQVRGPRSRRGSAASRCTSTDRSASTFPSRPSCRSMIEPRRTLRQHPIGDRLRIRSSPSLRPTRPSRSSRMSFAVHAPTP